MNIRFRWFGVAGLEFHADNQILLIDPFFTRPPLTKLFWSRVSPNRELIAKHIARADTILVTHAHYDHLMDVPDIARMTGATVYGSHNTCELLKLFGVPTEQIQEIHVGDELSLGNYSVNVIAAQHMYLPIYTSGVLPRDLICHSERSVFCGAKNLPIRGKILRFAQNDRLVLRLRDYVMDECFSFLIRVGDLRLLDWTGVLTNGVPADVLFTQAFQAQAHYHALVSAVNPRIVVPIHWDDFFRPLSKPLVPFFSPPRPPFPFVRRINLHEFKQAIENGLPKTNVQIPEVFRVYDVESQK
jgi:L-ascorbate metabolism protein UlaG (beta-lactamase superfamily)